MKLIKSIEELKKGDTVIIKDNEIFIERGFSSISGDVFSFDQNSSNFSIKCKETDSIEKIDTNKGKIFLIG